MGSAAPAGGFSKLRCFGVCLDQRSGFQRIFRMGFEVGFEARCPYAECPEGPALAKCPDVMPRHPQPTAQLRALPATTPFVGPEDLARRVGRDSLAPITELPVFPAPAEA